MAAATVVSTTRVMGSQLVIYDLTFASNGDTFLCPVGVQEYTWSVYGYTGASAINESLSLSSGTFTYACDEETGGADPTNIGVKLWVIERK